MCGAPRGRREFAWCLRCGAPLRSWPSRVDGFGVQCAELLGRRECLRQVAIARAIAEDVELLSALRPRRRRFAGPRARTVRGD